MLASLFLNLRFPKGFVILGLLDAASFLVGRAAVPARCQGGRGDGGMRGRRPVPFRYSSRPWRGRPCSSGWRWV